KDLLISIGRTAKLFHDEDDNAYAAIDKSDHIETYLIQSFGFKHWLKAEFYRKKGSGARNGDFSEALSTLDAIACTDGPEEKVYYRLAHVDGKIYLDLGRDDWNVVEISSSGWQIPKRSPVRFIRHRGMGALPEPQRGGSLDDLQRVINVEAADLLLIQAWLI